MKANRKLILALAAVLVAAALLAGVYLATRPAPAAGTKTFTVEVTHADGAVRTFSYTTGEAYVGKVLLDEGLVEGETGAYGLYIQSVDGEAAVYETDGAYWAVFVNGDYGTVGIDATPVVDGDVIGLVYTVG